MDNDYVGLLESLRSEYAGFLYSIAAGTNAKLIYEVGVSQEACSTKSFLVAMAKTNGKLLSCDIVDCWKYVPIEMRQRWEFYHMESSRFIHRLLEKADLIYLDGDHRYEIISLEVRLFWDVLKTGGFMILHDTVSDPIGPGRVAEMVQQSGNESVRIPIAGGFSIIRKTTESCW